MPPRMCSREEWQSLDCTRSARMRCATTTFNFVNSSLLDFTGDIYGFGAQWGHRGGGHPRQRLRLHAPVAPDQLLGVTTPAALGIVCGQHHDVQRRELAAEYGQRPVRGGRRPGTPRRLSTIVRLPICRIWPWPRTVVAGRLLSLSNSSVFFNAGVTTFLYVNGSLVLDGSQLSGGQFQCVGRGFPAGSDRHCFRDQWRIIRRQR